MNHAWKEFTASWNHFWFKSPRPLNLNVFYKLLGILIAGMSVERVLNFSSYYTLEGELYFDSPKLFILAQSIPHWVLQGCLIIFIGLTFSWCLRTPGVILKILTFLLHRLFSDLNTRVIYGVDSYIALFLFYALFIDFKRTDSPSSTLSIQCLKIHFCFTYIQSGLAKLTGVSWVLGEGVFLAARSHNPGSWFELIQDYPAVMTSLTHIVILVEIFGPVYLWGRFTNYVICLFIALHFGIMLTMGLHGFALVCIIGQLLFLRDLDVARLLGQSRAVGILRKLRPPLAARVLGSHRRPVSRS
jgi:hypothetical protein